MVTSTDPCSLTVPALVIDRIAPAHSSRLPAEWQPRLVELETGHCGPLEAPDEVAALLPASFRRRPRLSDPSGDSRERAEPGARTRKRTKTEWLEHCRSGGAGR
ncbi:alpha/beta fold hydrolase [Nocardia beijingensis]